MNVTRGVFGMSIPTYNADMVISQCITQSKDLKLIKAGQKIAVIHGTNEDSPDESNVMKILDA